MCSVCVYMYMLHILVGVSDRCHYVGKENCMCNCGPISLVDEVY